MIENEIESNKKGACLQDSPPGLGRFSDIYLSAAVQSCPAGLFYATGDSNGISYCIKKIRPQTRDGPYRAATTLFPH